MGDDARQQIRRAFWRGVRRGLTRAWCILGIPAAVVLFIFDAPAAGFMAIAGGAVGWFSMVLGWWDG